MRAPWSCRARRGHLTSRCHAPRRPARAAQVERYVRDLRVHSILEGTNQVMRLIIHREMGRLEG